MMSGEFQELCLGALLIVLKSLLIMFKDNLMVLDKFSLPLTLGLVDSSGTETYSVRGKSRRTLQQLTAHRIMRGNHFGKPPIINMKELLLDFPVNFSRNK